MRNILVLTVAVLLLAPSSAFISQSKAYTHNLKLKLHAKKRRRSKSSPEGKPVQNSQSPLPPPVSSPPMSDLSDSMLDGLGGAGSGEEVVRDLIQERQRDRDMERQWIVDEPKLELEYDPFAEDSDNDVEEEEANVTMKASTSSSTSIPRAPTKKMPRGRKKPPKQREGLSRESIEEMRRIEQKMKKEQELQEASEQEFQLPTSDQIGNFVKTSTWFGIILLVLLEIYINSPLFQRKG